jgi:cytochrome c oxidase assembly factor CtaG
VTDAMRLLGGWEPAPLPWLAVVAAGVWYVVAASRVTRRVPTHPWQQSRTWCFLAGLAVAAFALVGPPGAYDDVFFYAHMTQHILLSLLAAPLLVLGDPVLLVLRASSTETRRQMWVPVLRSRVVRLLTHPVFGWLLFVGVMGITHVPRVYDGFLAHPALHDYVEHSLYLVSAVVYFQPLLVPATGTRHVPHRVRLVSLFSMMVPMAMLGFAIFALPHLAYPYYAHVDRPFGPAAVADQHLAGILMWSTSMILGVVWLVVAAYQWLEDEERRTRRQEREESHVAPGART